MGKNISFLSHTRTHGGFAKLPDMALAVPTCDPYEASGALKQNRFCMAESFGVTENGLVPLKMVMFPVIFLTSMKSSPVGDSRRHCVATFEVCSMRPFFVARPGLSSIIRFGLLEDRNSNMVY